MRARLYFAGLLLALCATAAPCRAETPFEASARLIEAGQITEARRALEAELRMRPKHVEARYNLAVLLQEAGKNQDAASLYEQNLSIAWHLPSVVNLAGILQQQGKSAQAKIWLQQATKKFRHEATPWYLLAAISEGEGNNTEAEQRLRKAITTDPLNGFAHLNYAGFQTRHKLADHGIKEASKATRLLPDCAPCWRQYGDILRASGKQQAALKAYQRSLVIQPDSKTRQQLIHVLNSLGEHERAGRMQQALDAWQKHQPPELQTP